MALNLVTFDDKKNLNTNPDIPRINKVIDEDINELKKNLNETIKFVNSEEIKNKPSHIITTLSNSQSINLGLQLVKFDTESKVGDCFKLNNKTNKIEVLQDCVVLLSGSIFVDGTSGDGYVWSHIRVNAKDVVSNLTRIINRDYTQCSIPTIVKELSSGDMIDVSLDYATTGGTPKIRISNDNTFLSVVKI